MYFWAQTVSCLASPTTNTLTPITIYYDLVYLKPGSTIGTSSLPDFFTNSQSSCSTNECTYTFKDSSGNVMVIPKYIGGFGIVYSNVPSNLSGEWLGYISCRTDS